MGLMAQELAGRWSAGAIHDTVAAIAQQPLYAMPLRQSLFGRFFRYVLERIDDLLSGLRGSPDARFIVVAAVALVLLVAVGRIVVARRIDRERQRYGLGARQMQAGGRDYWSLAAELAASGDHMAALHALYAAALDGLTREGMVKLHSSKTSGDYARELRRRGSPAAQDFRAFVRDLDRVIYGSPTATAADYARLSRAAALTVRRTAAA